MNTIYKSLGTVDTFITAIDSSWLTKEDLTNLRWPIKPYVWSKSCNYCSASHV